MVCMKCGKNTEKERMFCARCLEVMEAYPVKPDAVVQLPSRNSANAPKKQTRKGRTDPKDARISALRRQVRLMWLVVIALLLAVALLLIREVHVLKVIQADPSYSYTEPTA